MATVGNYSLSLKREDIQMTDIEIAYLYLGIKKLPTVVNNPLREDNNPSLGVYTKDLKRVRLKDFATGDSYSLIDFLCKYWQLPRGKVYEKLYESIGGNQVLKSIRRLKKSVVSKLVNLEVKARRWRKYDLEYWASYGVTFDFLCRSHTYPISHIILQYEDIRIVNKAESYAYAYVEFKDNRTSIKVYQPFASRENKFKNNHHTSVWDLWNLLPPSGAEVIITSSRKDAMCLWCNLNIPSTCLQSESTLPNPNVIKELKSRFNRVYVLYDNDYTKEGNPGQTMANKLCKEYDLINLCLPSKYGCKDSSDLYKTLGKEQFIPIIQTLLIQTKNEKDPSSEPEHSNICNTRD